MVATALKLYINEEKDELAQIWAETAQIIKSKERNNWLPNISSIANLMRIDENKAVFSVPSVFHKDIAEETANKNGLILYLRRKLPQILDVSFEIIENEDAKDEEEMLKKAENERKIKLQNQKDKKESENKNVAQKPIGNFYPNYNFDSFVVCDTNKKAFDLCFTTAEMPENSPSKILAIYGKSGIGKTHLLQAIGQYAFQENTAKKIKYLSAIDFIADYFNFVKESPLENDRRIIDLTEFFSNYNDVDLLLIDDVHLFRGEGSQNAFFDILKFLYDSNKQIVITSDCSPADIPNMFEALKMRLNNGIAVEILAPSKKNRIQIIKKKYRNGEIHLNDEVLSYLADIPTTNIRELEGLYNRLLAASVVFNKTELELNWVKKILNAYIKDTRRITPDIILDRVCSYYAISAQDIRSSSRVKNIAYARKIAIYLIRKITGNSEQVIGNILSRDHSTICITCKKVTEEIKCDKQIEKDIETLTGIITGQTK